MEEFNGRNGKCLTEKKRTRHETNLESETGEFTTVRNPIYLYWKKQVKGSNFRSREEKKNGE